MLQSIDQPTFVDICRRAWAKAEPQLRNPSTRFSPLDVPVLFEIKHLLYSFFGVEDQIEGAYCIQNTPSGKHLPPAEHETFGQAYLRKIGDVINGKMNPPFDYVEIVNTYTQRAERQYREKEPPRPAKPRSRRRATGKRLSKRL